MKNKSKELDVDFIGAQKPMTQDEALAISEFIKSQKSVQNKRKHRMTRPAQQRKKLHAK
jgi:hypothetical protein